MQIKQDFSFAHRGVDIRHYKAGDVLDTNDAELIAVATEEGWIEKAKSAPENKARKAATDNKNA